MSILRKVPKVILVLLLVAVIVRVSAPYVVKNLINQQLDQAEGIEGQVEEVDLALFRGAYQLKGLTLYLQPDKERPTVYVDTIDLSILWSGLFRGDIIAEVFIDKASVAFVDQQNQEDTVKQHAKDADTWLTLIEFASPINIDRVVVKDSQFELFNVEENNEERTYLNNLSGQISNITNSRSFSGNKIANFEFSGDIMGVAKADLVGSINPDTALPTFDIDFSMQKLPVVSIDKFVKFYAPLDVERGDIDAAIEVSSLNGNLKGYVKAGIYNANVFSWEQDIVKDDDNLIIGLFEGIVDGVANLFESGNNNLIAIDVPIEGTIDNTQVSTLDAIGSLFHNAFVNEYEILVDDTINLSKMNK